MLEGEGGGEVRGEYDLGLRTGVRDLTRRELMDVFKTMKNGKAVPEGRVPKEAWEEIVKAGGEAARQVESVLRRLTKGGRLPRRWQESKAVQLTKHNGKRQCSGIRLINLLCPMGKASFKAIWRRLGEERRPWAYGFATGKQGNGNTGDDDDEVEVEERRIRHDDDLQRCR